MPIKTMRVVLCRAILRTLADRRVTIFSVAESAGISIVELRRLMEFASPLGEDESERLLDFARTVDVPKPVPVRKQIHKRKRWTRPVGHVSMTPELIGQDASGA